MLGTCSVGGAMPQPELFQGLLRSAPSPVPLSVPPLGITLSPPVPLPLPPVLDPPEGGNTLSGGGVVMFPSLLSAQPLPRAPRRATAAARRTLAMRVSPIEPERI